MPGPPSFRPVGLTRRDALALAAAGLAATLPGCGSDPPSTAASDPLAERTLDELRTFTRWLARERAPGFVGEVGWPDDARGEAERWNRLAERWFAWADTTGLWCTAWATGEWWGRDYALACYERADDEGPVAAANTQAEVLERHPSTERYLRGVNVAGGAFGAPSIDRVSGFSNANPGRVEHQYHFDPPSTFGFLRERGVGLVRVEFRWERIQPRLSAPLDEAELGRLRRVVAAARSAGLPVVLDLHNYGAYYVSDGTRGVRRPLGSAELPVSALADVWSRLSAVFADEAAVVGYGLMNEPVGLEPRGRRSPAQVWEDASQGAVDAIRGRGDGTVVLVGGHSWSAVQTWPAEHPRAWIRDPAGRVRYEAHHYWDLDHSSRYARSYAAQARALA